ncbi:MAG: diguanylate cyclase [Deltaproteobacteria bacterium]|nr:diguanylate cyclase [Deltaproteobacteria bacterium]
MPEKVYKVKLGGWRVPMSIATKTLLAFLLIITVLGGGFYYYATHTLSRETDREAVDSLKSNLKGALRLYQMRMEQMKLGMLQAGSEEAVREAVARRDSAGLKKLLDGYAASRGYVDLWAVVGPDGRVIARRNGRTGDILDVNGIVARALSSAEPVTSTETVTRDFLAKEGAELASGVEGGALMQIAVTPVVNGGRSSGAFVTGILLNGYEWLPRAIYENYNVTSAIIADTEREARVIASTSVSRPVLGPMSALPEDIGAKVLSNVPYAGATLLEGVEAFLAIEPLTRADGKVVGALAVGIFGSEVRHNLVEMKKNILLVTCLGVVFSLIFAGLSYRDTVKPISAITSAMDETANGNLNVRVEVSTGDDFEKIADGFNQMLGSIQLREKRLNRFNELSKILIQSNEPEALLRKALGRTIELTNSHMGAVYIHDEANELLKPVASFGAGEGEVRTLNFGEGLAGKCALERKTVLLEGINDANLSVETGFTKIMPSGLAWFPMICKEKLSGVFVLGSLHPYNPDEVLHIEYLVAQIAIALDNALIHKELEKLSVTDPLTGLYNRRHLFDVLSAEFSKAKRYRHQLAVMMIDIDNFKSINDTFGHQQGDRILAELSGILKAKTRTTDVWARYGGEEFMGFVTHCPPDGMVVLAEKVRKAVEENMFSGMNGRKVTVSIGIGFFPSEEIRTMEDLIKAADDNLYRAKNRGKNMVVIEEALKEAC